MNERDHTGLALKRKNTRRWCKGVAGREHVFAPKQKCGPFYDNGRPLVYVVDACVNCHKEVGWRSEYID